MPVRLRSLPAAELIKAEVNPHLATVLARPTSYHLDLSVLVQSIDWTYQVPSDAGHIVPLWGNNEDAIVRWTSNGANEFVSLSHEGAPHFTVATSEQGVMTKLWHEWCDLMSHDDDEPRRFAGAIGFSHWREGLSLWETDFCRFRDWMRHL